MRIQTLALIAIGVVAPAGPALAHAHLRSAVPAVKSTVTAAPSELDLVFSEGLELKFSGVQLSGSDGKAVPTGEPRLGGAGDTALVVPIATPLPAGTYTVKWRALSQDGHKTDGSYTFTVGH
jgi:methionine-rich copper-binding protein CopC